MSNQESEPVRQFKGVWIPREIWEHPDLTWLEKCLLAEIDSLSKPDKPCTASNDWLGKRFGVSEARMHNLIGSLRKRGFIEDAGFDGRIRSIRLHGFSLACLHGNRACRVHGNRANACTETEHSGICSNITTEISENTVQRETKVNGCAAVLKASEGDDILIGKLLQNLGALYHRPADTFWNYNITSTLGQLVRERRPKIERELEMLTDWRSKMEKKRFFPQSVMSLLRAWDESVDKARMFFREPEPKSKSETVF